MNQTLKRELCRATAPKLGPLWVRELRQALAWAALNHEALIEVPLALSKDRLVRFLARELHESDRTAVARLAAVVRRIGFVAACNVMIRTIQIQATGGLARDDGKGQRTAGGVFFYLTRALWAGKHWGESSNMHHALAAQRIAHGRLFIAGLSSVNRKGLH